MMPGSILVVEDDEDIAMLLELLLSREGYQVSLAKDGHAAQHFIEHNDPPDLVLLDVMLPFVDGMHLLKKIRITPIWADTKIVMLTAKSGEREVVCALNLGADDYISKPFKPMELVARVNHRLKPKKAA
jgi:DNA-binding response OmpR family regulator